VVAVGPLSLSVGPGRRRSRSREVEGDTITHRNATREPANLNRTTPLPAVAQADTGRTRPLGGAKTAIQLYRTKIRCPCKGRGLVQKSVFVHHKILKKFAPHFRYP
jgi:hypothetical protein